VDPSNVKAVLALKETNPKTVVDVRNLLGLLGYYRKYIQDFSRIAHPLFELLKTPVVKINKRPIQTGRQSQKGKWHTSTIQSCYCLDTGTSRSVGKTC